MLAELNDLCLDFIQSMVHVQYLNALDFGSVAFRISNGFCGLFTAEGATVPLILTRPIMGTIPFFFLLPFI